MARKIDAGARHLIALDLDGTVLDHDTGFVSDDSNFAGTGTMPGAGDDAHGGRIAPEIKRAIQKLHEAGHEVVIATGRSVDATLPIVERLGIRPDWVIAANGAVTLRRDPLATRAYRHEFVESFDPTEVLKRIRKQLFGARYAVELADGGFLYTQPIPAGTLPAKQTQVEFEGLLGVQASRVVVVSPDGELEEYLSIVERLGLAHVSYSVGNAFWLDIAPDGVTKASALERVMNREGLHASRVFAAGDGRNDIEMLRWAAKHGDAVAMGQALPEVQAAAGRVTGGITEDGLLTALRDRFPELLAAEAENVDA